MQSFANPITSNGTYEVTGLSRGHHYLLTAKGSFGSGTLTIDFWDTALKTYVPADDATFSGLTKTEARFISPAHKLRATLNGASAPNLSLNIIPIKQ